jgi:hypothetical protein
MRVNSTMIANMTSLSTGFPQDILNGFKSIFALSWAKSLSLDILVPQSGRRGQVG